MIGNQFGQVAKLPINRRLQCSTLKDIINSTKTITKEHGMMADSFRVNQLVFELKNKQWKLVRAYLEELSADLLAILE